MEHHYDEMETTFRSESQRNAPDYKITQTYLHGETGDRAGTNKPLEWSYLMKDPSIQYIIDSIGRLSLTDAQHEALANKAYRNADGVPRIDMSNEETRQKAMTLFNQIEDQGAATTVAKYQSSSSSSSYTFGNYQSYRRATDNASYYNIGDEVEEESYAERYEGWFWLGL